MGLFAAMFMVFLVIVFAGLSTPSLAETPDQSCSTGRWSDPQCIRTEHRINDTCKAIETFATDFGIDPGFFARLIWQESRFDPNALSPSNALGIAQFIRSTADIRGLEDPYNPAAALEHSAEYLAELTARYGNHGLAAAAYNGGEGRVNRSFHGGGFARETLNYVQIITGHPVESWAQAPYPQADYRLDGDTAFQDACVAMAATGRVTPQNDQTPAFKPWGVRLAWGTGREQALASYRDRTRSCRAILGPETLDLVTIPNRMRGRLPYVMAHISRDTRQQAGALCQRLTAVGCVCRVFKNP